MLNFACPVKSVFIFNRGSSSRKPIRLRRINYRNTLNILRIALKLHCVPKFEPVDKSRSSGTQKLGLRLVEASLRLGGQKGAFCKGLTTRAKPHVSFFNRLHSKKQVLII
jgi:hypothetical protein